MNKFMNREIFVFQCENSKAKIETKWETLNPLQELIWYYWVSCVCAVHMLVNVAENEKKKQNQLHRLHNPHQVKAGNIEKEIKKRRENAD